MLLSVLFCEVRRNLLYRLHVGVFEFASAEIIKNMLMAPAHQFEELLFKLFHLRNGHAIKKPAC